MFKIIAEIDANLLKGKARNDPDLNRFLIKNPNWGSLDVTALTDFYWNWIPKELRERGDIKELLTFLIREIYPGIQYARKVPISDEEMEVIEKNYPTKAWPLLGRIPSLIGSDPRAIEDLCNKYEEDGRSLFPGDLGPIITLVRFFGNNFLDHIYDLTMEDMDKMGEFLGGEWDERHHRDMYEFLFQFKDNLDNAMVRKIMEDWDLLPEEMRRPPYNNLEGMIEKISEGERKRREEAEKYNREIEEKIRLEHRKRLDDELEEVIRRNEEGSKKKIGFSKLYNRIEDNEARRESRRWGEDWKKRMLARLEQMRLQEEEEKKEEKGRISKLYNRMLRISNRIDGDNSDISDKIDKLIF